MVPHGAASWVQVPGRVGGERVWDGWIAGLGDSMSGSTPLLPFQPSTVSTSQLAAVSYLARYSGHTHALYAFQLRRRFGWCETNGLDPLLGIRRAHVELYIRQLGESGLMDSTVTRMMHGVRGFFRFAHIAASSPLIPRSVQGCRRSTATRPAPRALTGSLGINALRASEAAGVRIEDYADTLHGHRVLHLVGRGNKPATMPITVPVLRVLEACRGQRTPGLWFSDRSRASRLTAATSMGWSPGSRRPPRSPATSAHTHYGTRRSPTRLARKRLTDTVGPHRKACCVPAPVGASGYRICLLCT